MKTVQVIFLFSILATLCTNGQTVNGIPLSNLNVEYIQIESLEQPLSSRIKVLLDYGQYQAPFQTKNMLIYDDQGNPYPFNSMIQALNLLSKFGYTFIQSYNVLDLNNKERTCFILKKESFQREEKLESKEIDSKPDINEEG